MKQDIEFKQQLINTLPALNAFALSLSGRRDLANDLVQETMIKAWEHQDRFERGTNLMAWLFTILRNTFFTHLRQRYREIADVDGFYSEKVPNSPEQYGIAELREVREALALLIPEYREALILVGASGFSTKEAAKICNVPVGTIKSRVSRARTQLRELLADQNY